MVKKLPNWAKWKNVTAVAIYVTLLSGCQTSLITRYRPLHPENNHAVEFHVEAKDHDRIAKIELFVFEYELYRTPDREERARRRKGGIWGLIKTWTFKSPKSSANETYVLRAGFKAGSFITYIMQVTDSKNNITNECWSFAAGDWPWRDLPVPIWMASKGDPAKSIDVAFIAEEDPVYYSQPTDMLPDLEQLIYNGYHVNNGVKLGKKFWQFYYSQQFGYISDYDGSDFPLRMDIPSDAQNSIINHRAIIHKITKRDWSKDGNFGTEPENRGTAVHESGHSAFDQSDEKSDGKQWASSDPHHNVYDNLSNCQDYNDTIFSDPNCEEIDADWWRPEPDDLSCIMYIDGDDTMPAFARTCIKRIKWFYEKLED